MENTQTSPKPFVFVLMPFSKEFDDTYKLGIKAACEEAGMYCERVDEQHFDGTVLSRIYNQIATSNLIIADMTGRNPNVFYEVGYAHALNKRVILLTQREEDIPFDLKLYPHIVYGSSISNLKDELAKRLKWAIEQQDKISEYFTTSIQPYVSGSPIIGDPTFYFSGKGNIRQIEFEVSFQNTTKKSIQIAKYRMGIITPMAIDRFGSSPYPWSSEPYGVDSYQLDYQHALWIVNHEFNLLPGMWEKAFVYMSPKIVLDKFNCCIRLFTETGPYDFPFKIEIK